MLTEALTTQFGTCNYALMANVDGITHEDSLTQPTPGGSKLNWVLGHIVNTRNDVVALLGKESPFAKDRFAQYDGNPSRPWDAGKAIRFDELLEAYNSLQKPIMAGLQSTSSKQLSDKAPFSPTNNPDETFGSLLATLSFHEAYHVGQTGVLRRIAGKPGVLTPPEAVL